MLGIYLSVHRCVPAGQNTVVLGLSASSQGTKPLLSRNSATGSKHMRLRQNDTGGSVQKMCLWQPCCGLVAALLSRRWAHKRIRSIRTRARGRMALLRRRGRHYSHDNIWGGGAGRNRRYFLGLARLACCPLPLLLAEVHTHERHWHHHGAAIWPHRSCPTLSTHGFEAKTKSHFSCRGECGDELNFDELVYLHSIHTAGNILNDPVSTWSCYCVIKILACHLHLLGAVWSDPLVAKTPHLWEENMSPYLVLCLSCESSVVGCNHLDAKVLLLALITGILMQKCRSSHSALYHDLHSAVISLIPSVKLQPAAHLSAYTICHKQG